MKGLCGSQVHEGESGDRWFWVIIWSADLADIDLKAWLQGFCTAGEYRANVAVSWAVPGFNWTLRRFAFSCTEVAESWCYYRSEYSALKFRCSILQRWCFELLIPSYCLVFTRCPLPTHLSPCAHSYCFWIDFTLHYICESDVEYNIIDLQWPVQISGTIRKQFILR